MKLVEVEIISEAFFSANRVHKVGTGNLVVLGFQERQEYFGEKLLL